MNRIGDQDNAPVDINPDAVAEQVEQRLQQRTAERVAQDNWSDVYARLTETYGEWNKANDEVERRCSELRMSTQEATDLAKRSPSAFYELFLPKAGTPSQSSAASATSKQTSMPQTETTESDIKEYYKKLRKENPNKYWSPEVQAQYRRDLYGA